MSIFAGIKNMIGRTFHAVPPGCPGAIESLPRFIAESDIDGDIEAMIEAGAIAPWRIGPDGEQWFRRPADGDEIEAGGGGEADDYDQDLEAGGDDFQDDDLQDETLVCESSLAYSAEDLIYAGVIVFHHFGDDGEPWFAVADGVDLSAICATDDGDDNESSYDG